MIELTLPAGSMQAGLQAFAGGADAVYLGLRQYSARKHAVNFTFDELLQLKQEAVRQEKAIYVTLNTLLDDQELESTIPILRRLELVQPDGIIVQDLGLARLITSSFPSLAVHASTQIAVHTVAGVQEMQRMGFSRIVLSRELTFAQIEAIRRVCPDADLKVFIHGAMCYGFSGLCMASQQITGRSANRGECAQICRTWFSLEEKSRLGTEGYFFSMADLAAGTDVVRLRDIGINSLKVEGRMKSPAYVRFAARYYRMILDGETDPTALRAAREELDAQFARSSGGGWTFAYGKENPSQMRHTPQLSTVDFPAHRGTRIGTVRRVRADGIMTVELERDVSVRDGLMLLLPTETGLRQPLKWSLSSITSVDGTSCYFSSAGSTVLIGSPVTVDVAFDTPLYRISRHDLHVGLLHEQGLPSYRYPIKLEMTLREESITIMAKTLPSWMPQGIEQRYRIGIQRARTRQDPRENLHKIFKGSGEGSFTAGSISIINETPWEESELFIPLSSLKEIRRTWYAFLLERMEMDSSSYQLEHCERTSSSVPLPARRLLNNPCAPHIPWVDPKKLLRQLDAGASVASQLATIDGVHYLPLPPVTFDERATLEALERIVERLGKNLMVGLNNIAHVGWARDHTEVSVFADIYLYVTNWESVALLLGALENLSGAYHWVEREAMDVSGWPLKASPPGKGFTLPLFISRNCFRYDSLGLPCEGCPRHGSWHVEQNGRRYRVEVNECVTVVSEEPEQQ